MEHIKLQLGCLVILLYIAIVFFIEKRRYKQSIRESIFDELLILGIISVSFDAITAYMVNNLDTIPAMLNKICHIIFLSSLDSVIFALSLYIMIIAGVYPKERKKKLLINLPFIVNILFVFLTMDDLKYIVGKVTNYSMGMPAYTCFFMAAFYLILIMFVFFKKWRNIEGHKRVSIITFLSVLTICTFMQMLNPELLITSIGITMSVVGVYLNLENPAYKQLTEYHKETVMGFATLIENRDDNTGGHIRRTSVYVEMIARELLKEGYFKDVLTKDYITNLTKAAPMHDIGKIAVPDSILQKPDKLTAEEFLKMQEHTSKGGEIIKETFSNMGQKDYQTMAYEVARYHHEKWCGKGYPEGLKWEEIPLSARIMAVADVFDAISEKRCYREAMPLDTCFSIIKDGIGTDFDPIVAQAFLSIKSQVAAKHEELKNQHH